MSRTEQALKVLQEGGYFRKQLESQYRGGEKFVTRLRNAEGYVVKGVGFQTFVELESQLEYKECASSSVWPQEWKLKNG